MVLVILAALAGCSGEITAPAVQRRIAAVTAEAQPQLAASYTLISVRGQPLPVKAEAGNDAETYAGRLTFSPNGAYSSRLDYRIKVSADVTFETWSNCLGTWARTGSEVTITETDRTIVASVGTASITVQYGDAQYVFAADR
jgi:hypothetical protein